MNHYINQDGKSNTCKSRKMAVLSQAAKGAIYRSLDDFLKSTRLGIINEYGERIISGRRIC